MPRVTHTPVAAPGQYPSAGVAFTWLAADPANDEQFIMTGKELLLARNVGASPHTITITSVPDQFGRPGDITADSIAAGAFECYGPSVMAGNRLMGCSISRPIISKSSSRLSESKGDIR
jgi:hypothetical protein